MNARVRLIAPLLFGSGFCALVYQTAWQRELRLIFGASTAASAAVLAIFMGGLGLGGALLGARADRNRRPLGLYANLEFLIAASAAVTPLLVDLARATYVALGGTVALGLGGGSVVRLVLSALVLAVPTLLMGGTLPAAARAAETEEDVRRRALAVLYGTNTLGAVAGAAASTFLLLEVLGTRTTLWVACLLNALVALVARGLTRRLPEQEPSLPEAPAAPAPASTPTPSDVPAAPAAAAMPALPPRNFVLTAAALVGFAFFLMELVWYRMLGPLLGGTTFTFGLILVMALAGIGLGGAAYAAWGQQRPATLAGFALTCLLEAVGLALPFALGDQVAVLTLMLRPLSGLGFGGLVLGWALVAALVVFPAAFISGVQFPLLLALLGRGRENVGRQVGLAYAWNTVGSIAGALMGGFGLLPLLSAPGSWRLVGALLVALGLVAAFLSLRREQLPLPRLAVPVGSALLAVWLLSAVGPTAVWRHGSIGAGRAPPSPSPRELKDWSHGVRRTIIWEVDGVESSVGLMAQNGLAFIVNGKNDGNTVGDAGTQVMSGLIGGLLHPQPRRALVIGLGTGSTAGWLAAIPSMERVDVVEIEPAIDHVARQSQSVNERVLDNPKVHVFMGDAREVLLASREQYDIIFSEPSNPYRAGISSLFTREFYQAVKQRLTPGGLFVQWLQAYEVDVPTVRSAYATLDTEFPAVETWMTQVGDLVLVATEEPLRYDVERLRARVAEEPYRRALPAIWRTQELEGVLAHFLGGPKLAKAMARDQELLINTDDLSYLEFAFARSVGRKMGLSMDSLWQVSRRMGAERPEVARGEVDWGRVEVLKRLLVPPAGRRPPPSAEAGAGALQREAFLGAYARRDLRTALRLWREGGWQPRGLAERVTVAHVLAEVSDEAALPLVEELRDTIPVEAACVQAVLRLRQGRVAEATESLERAFLQLRQAPWGWVLGTTALRAAVEVARKDAAQGRRLYAVLAEPFASRALDDERLKARRDMAERLDFKALCAEVFAPYEPHVPWERAFLMQRQRCYEETGHALREQAQEDLGDFLAEEPASLEEAVAP
jgi:MFS family permease